MKLYVRLWHYLAEFLLEWKIYQTWVVEKTKTGILCSITFFPENPAVCGVKWEKYGRAREATDDNIIRRMHFGCR
jgi:hypothetical protein